MRLILSALLLALSTAALAAEPVPFFNGKDFTGWDGDTEKTWKIENGRIVLCSL